MRRRIQGFSLGGVLPKNFLNDFKRERLAPLLPPERGKTLRPSKNHRIMIEADTECGNGTVLEIDAKIAQLNTQLRFTGFEAGLLLNFRQWPLKDGGIKRVVHTWS